MNYRRIFERTFKKLSKSQHNRMQASSIIITDYIKIITASDIDDQDLGVEIAFPRFQEELIIKLLDETLSILKNLSLIYYLDTNLFIVGDLHGNIRDLIRILRQIKFFDSEARILFLGDYVDRGEFSLEVISLLFSLICQYPNRIYMLRGNHEFSNVNMNYGFKDQMHQLYDNDNMWLKFNTVFNYLPISAIVDKTVFCVHGGISPHMNSIYQIEVIERPILTFNYNSLVADLMWSDPSNSVTFFLESERGFGCVFGQDAIFEFCRNQKMDKVIRSHQCVKNGIETLLHGKVVTVFSCSNYCDQCNNDAGFIYVTKKGIESFRIKPLKILKRDQALFIDCIRKSEDESNGKVEAVHNQNLNLMNNNLNTGYNTLTRKRVPAKRKSSFSQPFNRAVPIPLAAVHMGSNEHFFNKRITASPVAFTRSSQVFAVNDSDKKNMQKKNSISMVYKNDMKMHVPSLPPIGSDPRKSNIPPLPQINDDHLQKMYLKKDECDENEGQ